MLMKTSGAVAIEPVFDEGVSAAKALVSDQLERLDAPTYQKVRSMMLGFAVSREESVVAAPSADFFLKMAREKGTLADRDFFEVYKRTYPESTWPAYVVAQTDTGGCRVFDGTLTGLYGAWIAFRKSHPTHYREAAEKELAGIEEALGSTCVCGGADGVRKELEGFLKAFPNSPPAAMISERLESLRNHTSDIRFNCKER